jgi:methyl-accepting chemotaxis protein
MGKGSKLVPRAVRSSYLRKFTLIVVVIVIATGAFGFVIQGQVSGLLVERTNTEVESTAQLNANSVEAWADGKRQTARMLSNYQVSQTGNLTEIRERYRAELPELGDDVVDIHYLAYGSGEPTIHTSTDDGLVGTPGEPAGIDLGTLDVTWQNGSLGPWTEDVLVSHVYQRNGVKRIAFVAPIRGDDRSRAVMVVANATASSAAMDASFEGGFTRAVNDKSIVALSSDPKRIEREYLRGRETTAYERGSQGLVGTTSMTTTGGQELLVGYAPVERTEWVMITHVPRSEALALQQTVSRSLLALIGLFLAGFLVVGFTIGRGTTRSLQDLAGKARELEEGNLDADIRTDRVDEFGTVYDAFGEMRDSLRTQIEEAERARKEAEVARAEAMEVNEYLQGKAEEYSETMQRCARGDLTERMEADGENDAMDRIAEEFNEMIRELEMTTGQLKSFSVAVQEGGVEVRKSAVAVRDASEQVAESIQSISDDAFDQQERLETVADDIEEAADALESVAGDQPDVAESLDRIRAVGESVREAADLAENTLAESETVAGAAEEQAAELTEVSDQAEELTRNAEYLADGLENFETEQEHEFVFQTGAEAPTSGGQPGDR